MDLFERCLILNKKSSEKSLEKILDLSTNNAGRVAEMTGLNRLGIEWNLFKFKTKGLLERISPDKGGYWKVIHHVTQSYHYNLI